MINLEIDHVSNNRYKGRVVVLAVDIGLCLISKFSGYLSIYKSNNLYGLNLVKEYSNREKII